MKKFTAFLFVLFSFNYCDAQNYVTIPDPYFVDWLVDNYPDCMNGNQMDTTCAEIVNAKIVDCSVYYISNLDGIQYFDSLDSLVCGGDNTLSEIPSLPPFLKSLTCNQSYLDNLPQLPSSLKELDCSINPIKLLPTLPQSLESLYCDHCRLKKLPDLPLSLRNLSCKENDSLNELPLLPISLEYLECSGSSIFNLPLLPEKLTALICDNDSLSALPTLPDSLEYLSCNNNLLKNLPSLPAKLVELYCNENQLNSLPDLPLGLERLDCSYNPNILCSPFLPESLYEVDLYGTSIKCTPNEIIGVTTLPICDSQFNPNGCPTNQCNAHFTLYRDTTTALHWFALNECVGKSPLNYSWTWGDGSSASSGATPSHTYSAPGYYKICVTITDDTLCTSTFCDSSIYVYRMEEEDAMITVDVVTSLPTESHLVTVQDNSISIYPNPVSEILFINSTAKEIELKDLLGRSIYKQSISEKQTKINISHFSPGVYFALIKNYDGSVVVRKFVKE